jgi:hypothetical protein
VSARRRGDAPAEDRRGRMPGGGPQSAVDGEDEASRLPTRRHPTPSRGQVPGGGPQSAVDGEDEAGGLPARRPPTTSRGQVSGGGPQGAVGLVARDVKQSMSVVEPSRKSVRREGGACQPQGPAGRSSSRESPPVWACFFRTVPFSLRSGQGGRPRSA